MGQYTRTIKLEDDSLELSVTFTHDYRVKIGERGYTPEEAQQKADLVIDEVRAILLREVQEVVKATNSQIVGPDD